MTDSLPIITKPHAVNTTTTPASSLLRRGLVDIQNKKSLIDPEMFADGICLAGYHIERGARTFDAYVKAMIADMGDEIIPYLKQFYEGVREDSRAKSLVADMDDAETIERIISANQGKAGSQHD